MSWENVVSVRLNPSPVAALSISILPSKARRGHPRISFNFNKSMTHQYNLRPQSRAEIEVGRGQHIGFVRITFDRPSGSLRLIDGGGGGKSGVRVSSSIWPELKTTAMRVRIDPTDKVVFNWDAEKRTAIIAIPPSFMVEPTFPNDLRAVLDDSV